MKHLILAAAVALTACQAQAETHLQVHGISHHLEARSVGQWNERNVGLGMRKQYTRDLGVQAGFYRNSIDRTTAYLLGQYTPLHVGSLSAGVFAGLASGYNYKYPLAGGLLATYQGGKYSTTLRYIPSIKGIATGVLGLEVGVKF